MARVDQKRFKMWPMRQLADEQNLTTYLHELAGHVASAMTQRADEPWALIGIRSRGDIIAQRLAIWLESQSDVPELVGVGSIDITMYRDDLSDIGPSAVVQTTDVPFEMDAVNVVLVDDVLMTGRSVRAALQALMDLGRPRRVWLAVLVDRGGRQLPITPDFVGLDLATSSGVAFEDDEKIVVRVKPNHDRDAILVQRVGETA